MKHESTPHRPFTIVSLAAVAWDFPLVGRTRMLTEAWDRVKQRTIFVEAPHSWRSVAKSIFRSRPRAAVRLFRPRPSYPVRFWGYLGDSRIRGDMLRRARSLRRVLDHAINWDSSIAMVISPAWVPWLEELPFSRVVYDCIDHLSVHAPQRKLLPLFEFWERELIQRADGAVATADVLAHHLRALRSDLPVEIIRNGVDIQRFQSNAAQSRPDDLPAARPLIGFVGALFEWIDWDLIDACVRACPKAIFVFIGPTNQPDAVRRLSAHQNVRFLGPRPYAAVPAYLAAFDVCWVPFKAIAISAAANPVKIYEYLAAGRPVISTAVADIDTFGDLVSVISSADEFSRAMARLLPEDESRAARRRQFAADNDWSRRAADVVKFLQRVRNRETAPSRT